jgi:predicted enzyme related to lactoylglutathione lyase
MGERTSYVPGTFSWVELGTTDAAGAKAFYGGLFGWEGVDFPVGDQGVYTMLQLDGMDVAALYEQGADGGPPAWLAYVTVADADAAGARVRELGGNLLSDPFDVFDAGRMVVARDPQGAVFALWQAARHIGAGRVNDVACFCWNELETSDPAAATRFYGELFGWRTRPVEGGAGYLVIEHGERTNGAVSQLADGDMPRWNVYFTIASADEAVPRIGELGGRVLAGPIDATVGRFVVAEDPQGAAFVLFEGDVDD